ncbi:hypothetical protein [Phocaeicola faecalis]|mgnify:FL=1
MNRRVFLIQILLSLILLIGLCLIFKMPSGSIIGTAIGYLVGGSVVAVINNKNKKK